MFKILGDTPIELKTKIAEDLIIVVENQSLVPLYKSHIERFIQQLKRTRPSIDYNNKAMPIEEDIEKLGSERAKRLLKLTMTAKENDDMLMKSKPFKLPFERLEQVASLELVPSRAVVNLASSNIQNSKLNCVICNETAKDPCAARCGHVCCQGCWLKWLPIKPICPVCRRPAATDSITRIVVKK